MVRFFQWLFAAFEIQIGFPEMMPLVLSLMSRLRRRSAPLRAERREACVTPVRDPRETARALAQAIDRAMERGLWEHADRIAATAMPLAHEHAVLCERMVRLRLVQDKPGAALELIDHCRQQTSSMRLLRSICMLHSGRQFEAHMELREWACKPSAPLPARLLLGLLEWRMGDAEAAVDALHQNLRQIEDPQSLMALMLISASQGNTAQTRWWRSRLQQASAHSFTAPHANPVALSLGLPPSEKKSLAFTGEQVESLGLELLSCETVIPALVQGLQLRPDEPAAGALVKALQRLVKELDNRSAGYAAIVNLLLMLGDRSAAVEWARRGFEANPMSVTLAQLVIDLDQDSTEPQSDQQQERAA